MARREGANSQFLFVQETAWKTTPGAPTGIVLPLESESLTYARPHEQDPTILSGRVYQKPGRGAASVSGDVTVRLNPLAHAYLLKQLLGPPTTTGADPYTHTFGVGTPPVGFEIERGFPADASYHLYKGLRLAKASFAVKGSGLLPVTFSMLGGTRATSGSSVDATPTSLEHTPFDLGGTVTLEEGGSPIATAVDLTLDIDNETEADPPAIGGAGEPAGVAHGKCKVSGMLKALFFDDTLYTKAQNHTETSLDLVITRGDGLGSLGNESLQITLGSLVYEPKDAPVNTPRGLYCELAFNGYGTLGLAMILKNSLATL